MIGKITIGKSFRGCLLYCLQDKLEEQKQTPLMERRAEVILYNRCYGNDKELIRQFNEVRQLNPKLAKPVLHITLGLAPGEKLPSGKLQEIAEDCAKEMGFSNNQFVAILHKDTGHQHLHIVANRIDFNGKTLSDSNNYQKIANYCRRMELKHHLKQVLNPRRFLAEELRNTPRLDQRKQKLKEDIKACLAGSKDYAEFEQKMKSLRYQVIRARGIAFKDPQKVYTKGSELGFSLSTIEKLLTLKQELRNEVLSVRPDLVTKPTHKQLIEKPKVEQHKETSLDKNHLLDILLKSSNRLETINPALLSEAQKRRKIQRHKPT